MLPKNAIVPTYVTEFEFTWPVYVNKIESSSKYKSMIPT